MTDMLAMIERIWRDGCPNCRTRRGTRLRRVVDPERPTLLVVSVICGLCNITWEAPPVPASEASMSSPLEFFDAVRDTPEG